MYLNLIIINIEVFFLVWTHFMSDWIPKSKLGQFEVKFK